MRERERKKERKKERDLPWLQIWVRCLPKREVEQEWKE